MPDAGREQAACCGVSGGLDSCGWMYKWKQPCHAKELCQIKHHGAAGVLQKSHNSLIEARSCLLTVVPQLLTSGLWYVEPWLFLSFWSDS